MSVSISKPVISADDSRSVKQLAVTTNNELMARRIYNELRADYEQTNYKQTSQPYLTIGIPTRILCIISFTCIVIFIIPMFILIYYRKIIGAYDNQPLPWKPVSVYAILYILMGIFSSLTPSARTHKIMIGLAAMFIITVLCYLSVSRQWLYVLHSSWNRKWHVIYYIQWLTTTPLILLMFGSLTNSDTAMEQLRMIDILNNKPVDILVNNNDILENPYDNALQMKARQHLNITSMIHAVLYNTLFIICAITTHCIPLPYARVSAFVATCIFFCTIRRIDIYLRDTPMVIKQKHIDLLKQAEDNQFNVGTEKYTPKLRNAYQANMNVLMFLRLWIGLSFTALPIIWSLGATHTIDEFHEHVAYFIADVILKIGVSSGLMSLNTSSVDELSTLKQALLQQQFIQSSQHSYDTQNQNRAAFLRYLFHEIRGPLNAVVLGLCVTQSSNMSPEYVETYNIMIDGVNRCTRLLDDANSLNTYDTGQMQSFQSSFSIAALIQQILLLMRPAIDANRVKVSVVIDKCVPAAIIGDKAKITQVFANYLSNAIQYSPKNDAIIVNVSVIPFSPPTRTNKRINAMQRKLSELVSSNRSSSTDIYSPTRIDSMLKSLGLRTHTVPSIDDSGSSSSGSPIPSKSVPSDYTSAVDSELADNTMINLKISVTDNGCGIHESDQHKLFLPYQQINLALKTKSLTTGLGLSVCARIIEHLNGSKGVISRTGANSYTTVWFSIPVRSSELDEDDYSDASTSDECINIDGTMLYQSHNVVSLRQSNHTHKPATPPYHPPQSRRSSTVIPPSAGSTDELVKSNKSNQARHRRHRMTSDIRSSSLRCTDGTVQPRFTQLDKLQVPDYNRPKSPILTPLTGTRELPQHASDVHTPVQLDNRNKSAPPVLMLPDDKLNSAHNNKDATETIYKSTDTSTSESPSSNSTHNLTNESSDVSMPSSPALSVHHHHHCKHTICTMTSPPRQHTKLLLPLLQSNPSDKHIRCLIVDDVSSNRKLLEKVLSKTYGFICDQAIDGVDCVEKVQSTTTPYDCILIDDNMPRMSGSEATTIIRELGYNQPVIGITGNTLQTDIDNFIVCGANAVLSKPVNVRKLIRTLINTSPALKLILRQYASNSPTSSLAVSTPPI